METKDELNEDEKKILSEAARLMGRKGGKIGGSSKSEAKIRASRENGKLGGRPRKTVKDNTEPKGGK
jgi:hypothetical protein